MKCSCNLSINRFQCDSQPQSSSYVFSKEHCVHAFLNLLCGPCLTKDNRGFTGNQTGAICRYLIYYKSDALTREPGEYVERVKVGDQRSSATGVRYERTSGRLRGRQERLSLGCDLGGQVSPTGENRVEKRRRNNLVGGSCFDCEGFMV